MRRALIPVLTLGVAFGAGAPASHAAAGLKGTWRGVLRVTAVAHPFQFPTIVHISALQAGRRGGWLSYPGTPCHGKLVVLAHNGALASFRYRETSGSKHCTGDDRVNVGLRGGRLRVQVVPPNGKAPGHGTLTRRA